MSQLFSALLHSPQRAHAAPPGASARADVVSVASTSSVSPSTLRTANGRPARQLGLSVRFPELAEHTDLPVGHQRLDDLVDRTHEILDAGLNPAFSHPAVPVHDLEGEEPSGGERADEVPRPRKEQEEDEGDEQEHATASIAPIVREDITPSG